MMTATECYNQRIARHSERIKRLEERDALSLEISEDEAEYIEFCYHQELAKINAKPVIVCELFQVTTGVGL